MTDLANCDYWLEVRDAYSNLVGRDLDVQKMIGKFDKDGDGKVSLLGLERLMQ